MMGAKRFKSLVGSNNLCLLLLLYCLFFRLFVRLNPLGMKKAKPIRPNFFVGPHMTPGKVHGFFTKLPGELLIFRNPRKNR